ncbi:MAG TPA: hypothetical protein VFT70_06280 [Nocardioides sp.]|nr:hypothetical protein [Nocardioides sp.]
MRGVDVVRSAAGVTALVWPAPVARLADDHRVAVRRAARLLGARWLAQAAVSDRLRPGHAAHLGVGIDVVHAVSMLAAARRWPGAARPALLSAGVASALAVADARSSAR